MGAAASVQLAYQDAILWFRQYFDAETYIEDFKLIDKDHDGAIRFSELQIWLTHKAKTEGGPWKYFINNSEIFTMAHYHSSKYVVDKFLVKKKIVDIIEFRTLLVQLFVISILWIHFKKADSCSMCGDPFNDKLSFMEFKLAAKTFCAVYGHEELSEQQMRQDFQLLDVNKDGSISFAEICNFCCKCVDLKYLESAQLRQIEQRSRGYSNSFENSGHTTNQSDHSGCHSHPLSARDTATAASSSASSFDPSSAHGPNPYRTTASVPFPIHQTTYNIPIPDDHTATSLHRTLQSFPEDNDFFFLKEQAKAKDIREHSAAVGILLGEDGDYLPPEQQPPLTVAVGGQGGETMMMEEKEGGEDYYLLRPLHTIPSRTLLKELMEPLTANEFDRIAHVPREQYRDGTTAAMMSILAEMKKQEHVQHLAEIRFATELSLEQQGFTTECITGITLTTTLTNTFIGTTTLTNAKSMVENPFALLLSTAH